MSGRPAVYAHTATGGRQALEQQEAACRRYLRATSGGDADTDVYSDEGMSRAGRDELLAAVDARRHSLVVVHAFDRLSRSAQNLAEVDRHLGARVPRSATPRVPGLEARTLHMLSALAARPS